MHRLPRRAAGALALVLAIATPAGAAAASSAAQDENALDPDELPSEADPIAPPFAEGPLENDAFLPVDSEAVEALAAGDARLADARAAATRDGGERALREALEAWARVASRLAGPGAAGLDGAPVDPEREGGSRLVEGLASALRRRVAGLTDAERERWRTTFEPVAATRPAQAEAWPGTEAAPRAALGATDRALESGRLAEARAALTRARALAALLPAGRVRATLEVAVERRTAALGAWTAAGADTRLDWERAQGFELLGSILLVDDDLRRAVRVVPGQEAPGLGARPGLVVADERTLLVQDEATLWRVELARDGRPTRAVPHSLDDALLVVAGPFARPRIGRDEGGWPLRPQRIGNDVLLVHGASGGSREGVPNVLARLPQPPRGESQRTGLLVDRLGSAGAWTPRWALAGGLRWTPGGEVGGTLERLPALEPLGPLEWQPGVALVDGTLVAQARVARDRTEAWLVGLDAGDGSVLWTRRLGAGAAHAAGQARFTATVPRAADPPLVVAGGLVLAPTQLGLQALVEPHSGALVWTLATRRSVREAPPWTLPGPWSMGAGEASALLAPPDSDRLYALRCAPLGTPWSPRPTDEALPLAAPVLAQGSAEALLAAVGERPLVLRRDGRERTLALLGPPGTPPLDAFHVGPEEAFRGSALASERRVVAASDRALYLLDVERDLALLDVVPLEPRGRLPGGDVVAAGPWVVVLGFDALWVLRARP